MNIDQIKIDVVGKWAGIFDRFGIDVGSGEHKPCPVCGGFDRFRFDDKEQRGTWFCNGCSPNSGDGWALFQNALGIDFKTAAEKIAPLVSLIPVDGVRQEPKYNAEVTRKLYLQSRPMQKNDLAYKYLCNRGLKDMDLPKLRFSPKCYENETGKEHPAMLGIFMSHKDEALTIHRTYLTPDGQKLGVRSPKKILTPKHPMPGGAVRLYDWSEGPLAIAEGIETAIAVSIVRKIPVWAALTSTLLQSFIPPEGVTSLEIYGDNDINFTGQKSANVLAHRVCMERNINVDVFLPNKRGTDFLDELITEIAA